MRSGRRINAELPKGVVDSVTEEALAWLVHLHSGIAGDEDWTRYELWKDATSIHHAAAERAEGLWEKLGPALKPPRRRGKSITVVLLLLGALGGLGFASGLFGEPAAYFADERTGIGESRSVTLRDGSVVDLDSDTSFDIDFTPARRRLILYAGQIYVTVKPDPSRPFVVAAAGGAARALGTAFDVEATGDAARVFVTQHVVRVSYPEIGNGPSVDLPAGQLVAYALKTGLAHPEPADIAGLTAWRRGQMIFANRPLSEVTAEISRYHRGKVIITDASLRKLPITGVFDTKDADGLMNAVASALPVRVIRLPWITFIQPDPSRVIGPSPN